MLFGKYSKCPIHKDSRWKRTEKITIKKYTFAKHFYKKCNCVVLHNAITNRDWTFLTPDEADSYIETIKGDL